MFNFESIAYAKISCFYITSRQVFFFFQLFSRLAHSFCNSLSLRSSSANSSSRHCKLRDFSSFFSLSNSISVKNYSQLFASLLLYKLGYYRNLITPIYVITYFVVFSGCAYAFLQWQQVPLNSFESALVCS